MFCARASFPALRFDSPLSTWKEVTLMESPSVTSLPVHLQTILASRTSLDAALYTLIKHRFEALLAEQGSSFAEEVADFKVLNAAYLKSLTVTDAS
eukprot:m.302163 g.302163  ORF g.302163 m.302163 type:complete len:96 (-) comp55230_c0_seq5:55-342(-)